MVLVFVSCLPEKKKGTSTGANEAIFTLEDFNLAEINNFFLPCSVDPGRKSIFTATVGHNSDSHEIRSCTSKERQCYTGSMRRQAFVNNLKSKRGIKEIETQIPSPKTLNIDELTKYVNYILTHLDTLFTFYNEKSAPFRFYDYQGRQRANDELANMLIDGGKKYNKKRRKKTKRNKQQNKKRGKTKREVRLKMKKEKKDSRKKKFEEKKKRNEKKSKDTIGKEKTKEEAKKKKKLEKEKKEMAEMYGHIYLYIQLFN
jgi:hypothetical protein